MDLKVESPARSEHDERGVVLVCDVENGVPGALVGDLGDLGLGVETRLLRQTATLLGEPGRCVLQRIVVVASAAPPRLP